MNPPGHHPDAKDFVAVDNPGKPYKAFRLITHIFSSLNVNLTYSFSKPVFAPFDGHIVELENNQNDRQTLNLLRDFFVGLFIAPRKYINEPKYFLGNHLIIQSDEGIYALLAHLKQGSITMQKGMPVKAGDCIAQVGNSGNTIQSHLHFHLMGDSDPVTSVPLPFVLASFEGKKASGWVKKYSSLPGNFSVFRVRDSG